MEPSDLLLADSGFTMFFIVHVIEASKTIWIFFYEFHQKLNFKKVLILIGLYMDMFLGLHIIEYF